MIACKVQMSERLMDMEYCKLQIGCMIVILYIIFNYYQERMQFRQRRRVPVFEVLLWGSVVCVFFDGITAVTVNYLEQIPYVVNQILHLCFLLSIDWFISLLFIYICFITQENIRSRFKRFLLCSLLALITLIVVVNIRTLEFRQGEITNYSMGVSAYTCFAAVAICLLGTIIIYLKRWKYIKTNKRISILTYLIVIMCVTIYQSLHPQALLTSLASTMIVLGAYVNQENPAMEELSHYHKEMIMGFATLVENRDGNTGGHIRRTTKYVGLIVSELQRRGKYSDILTKDYVENLLLAAPMHDIGKISIPDAILQKPGRLTEDEFSQMKLHAENGGKIIRDTFGNLGEQQFNQIAYEVARYHHEKWNGNGYPENLKQEEIPLSARIMAIADVFDAVSEKRCYRDAMPLETCFKIIEEGSGKDFDPDLVEVFLYIKDIVEEVHRNI